ncbi:MAG: response regulator [Candidatus Omnitrophica bacterium]|nr:response regulator [Candidatus Omnitrophota bacterium]
MMKHKILIIDDEKEFTVLIKEVLENTGKYEVETVNKARMGFSSVTSFNPDMILLDLVMPEEDGISIALKIRDDEKTKDVPIIFLTGIIKKEEILRQPATLKGIHFLAKPVSLKELISTIEMWLPKK